MCGDESTVELLVGKIIERVEFSADQVEFTCQDGDRFAMHHMQDCCEIVRVFGVHGRIGELLGSLVVSAESEVFD